MNRQDRRAFGAAALMLLSLALFSRAQVQPDDTSGDDPNRGAARVSVIQGEVNVKRGDSSEIVAAAVNAPRAAQDHLQTRKVHALKFNSIAETWCGWLRIQILVWRSSGAGAIKCNWRRALSYTG